MELDKIIEILKRRSGFLRIGKKEVLILSEHEFESLAKEIAELDNDWTKEGDEYFLPAPTNEDFYGKTTWRNDGYDQEMMARGLVFRTPEEAIEAAKKMLNSLQDKN